VSAIRFYLDEDAMDGDVVRELRHQGIDLVTAGEMGTVGRSDDQHLDYASADGRVLYSFNFRDYYRIHRERLSSGKHHAGLVIGRQQRHTVGEQVRRLMGLVRRRSAESMVDQIEFLSGLA
jgi:hypothetical protein